MDLTKIISVSGKSGLFRVVAQSRQAVIAESLLDGKKVLEELYEVEKGKASLDPKESEDKLFAKLGEALPDHDRERIYASDVRKLFAWYDQLLKAGEFEKKEEKKAVKEEKETAKTKAAKEGAPKKVTAAKKAAPKAGASTKAKSTTMRKSAQRGA